MLHRTLPPLTLTIAVFLAACRAGMPISTKTPSPSPSRTSSPSPAAPIYTFGPSLTPDPKTTPLPATLGLDPSDWHNWPVISPVPENARQIYTLGQSLGNDPHAFSVFGDCNSMPGDFLGIFETDSQAISMLPSNLQETVTWFRGSFNRLSPTVRAGTTTGALLWTQWHQNMFTCTIEETPLQCELRIHKPSFVIIQIGSHYEARNEGYMQKILAQLISAGVVPILATKADDIDPDEHVNAQYAKLAVEYNIPFWNFWAAVKDLPNRGLYSRPEDSYQGGLYLTDDAIAIHRMTALQMLDVVRRAVTGGE